MTDTNAPATPAPDAPAPKAARVQKPKLTFMLHKPGTFESLGKYVSTDYRYAALKVASRGKENPILLRKTNTKLVYEFTGNVVELDTPQVVSRGERTITYSKKPVVKFIRKFTYEGDVDDSE